MSDRTVTLIAENPDVLQGQRDGSHFEMRFPEEIYEETYQYLRDQIEFRRKCMNQGFDNLLELLDRHWNLYQRVKAKNEQVQPTETR